MQGAAPELLTQRTDPADRSMRPSAINGSAATASGTAPSGQFLSEYACRHIQKHIISPILKEERLKNFHPLVGSLPHRVNRKEITCLRDLEKVLLWLAPVSAPSRALSLWVTGVLGSYLCGAEMVDL